MVGTIGSLGQEASSRGKGVVALVLYLTGSIVAGSAFGATLGLAGRALTEGTHGGRMPPVATFAIALLALGYSFSDLGLLRLPRPRALPAVPATWWRRWGPYRASVAYGLTLGVGVSTRIPFGGFYVICAWAVASGSVPFGAAVFGAYGLARGIALCLAACALRRSADFSTLLTSRWLSQSAARDMLVGMTLASGTALVLQGLGLWHS